MKTASSCRTRPPAFAVGLLLLSTASCVTSRAMRDGEEAESREHWDVAYLAYQKAYQEEPKNLQARSAYERVRMKAAQVHYERGKVYHQSGDLDQAALELEQSVALDPTSDAAQQEFRMVKAAIARRQREVAGATPIEEAKAKARGVRATPPMLSPSSDKPIDVSFPPDTPIKKIYQALAAAAGINVIFDPQLKDDRFTLDLRGMTFQKALEVAMRQAGHFYKVLDDKTIIIAQDTQQNRREYEDLVIQTFFLSNGDVKDVSAMVRGVLDMRRLQPVPQLNAIVIRDTADKVAVAQKLIEVNDKAKSEVVVDVELLLMSRRDIMDLGMQLSQYATTVSIVGADGKPVSSLTWDQFKTLTTSDLSITIPSVTFNFLKNNTDGQVLAKPQLRIAEGEKAQLIIGEKQPIPVSTYNTTQSIGQVGVVPITSFQYQDVGIKMEIEPRVHHNKEVTLKLMLEISAINGYAPNPGGSPMPIISTRTVTSTVRLKDGETNFLAGLIRKDKAQSKDKIPFLSDLPVVGPLFTHYHTDDTTTDIFMTLTPHIVRQPQITPDDLEPIWVGTENNVSYSGLGTRIESPSATGSPFMATPPTREVRPAAPGLRGPGSPLPFGQGSGPSNIFQQSTPQPTTPQQPVQVPQPAVPGPGTSTPSPSKQPGGSASAAPETSSESASAAGSTPASAAVPPAAAAVAVAGDASTSPSFRLESSAATIAPGETATVSLVGEAGLYDTRLFEVNIAWDPSVVEVTRIVPGSWSDASGAEVIRFDAEKSPGRAWIQMLRRDGSWGMPEGPLARLEIRAKGGGTALLRAAAGSAVTRRGTLAPVVLPAAVTVAGKV
ncbi:MAG: secretin N-terminal domain-containing protein [Acidithiobacillales bacterium]